MIRKNLEVPFDLLAAVHLIDSYTLLIFSTLVPKESETLSVCVRTVFSLPFCNFSSVEDYSVLGIIRKASRPLLRICQTLSVPSPTFYWYI